MKNLTLSIDEEVLKEARKQALERGTSVNQMVREYLEEVAGAKERRRKSIERLKNIWEESEAEVGEITWNRDDLYRTP